MLNKNAARHDPNFSDEKFCNAIENFTINAKQ